LPRQRVFLLPFVYPNPLGKEDYPVPITREQKAELLAVYTEKISRAQAAYITDYRGLTVSEIADFRTELRKDTTAELEVAKNTLLGIAFQQAGWAVPSTYLEGPTAVVICYDDPGAPAKVLRAYAKKNDKVKIKGGVLGQSVLDAKGVDQMADLPGRDEIRAQVIGALQGPAQNIFGTIIAPLREIVQVLHARGEQGNQEAA